MSGSYPPPEPDQNPQYQPYGQPYGQPGQPGQQPVPYGYQAGAPFGVDPLSGVPYSDKQKLVAGLLQILIPLGIGRFYAGQTGLGVAQLLVTIFTCGLGALWPFIDGIIMLTGRPVDQNGRPLR